MILTAQTLDFLSINVWHILMAIGNLLILVLLLKKFLFKPVNDIIAKREAEVQKIYSDADEALEKANADKLLYAQKMVDAKREADNLIKTASEHAKAQGDEIVTNAKLEAQRRREQADADIELAKKKAADAVKDSISDMVISLAEKVVEKELDEMAHSKLIDDAIDSLGDDL